MLKQLTESWKYGLIIDDNMMSDTYGCILKIYDFEGETDQ